MHDDDVPVGRLLDRRQAMALFGIAGATLATTAGVLSRPAAAATKPMGIHHLNCVVRPEQMEGPYFVDEKLNRSDIRSDPSDGTMRPGTLFTLNLDIQEIVDGDCRPIKGAVVDTWQCDALGVYSDVADQGTVGKKYLRGYQVTDENGKVQFVTILPGWYQGRAVHHHIKVRTTGTDGKPYEFTSQLYFHEEFKAGYFTKEPYASRGMPDTTNSADWIFTGSHGDQLLLDPTSAQDGYAADFSIGLDLSDTEVGKED
ncbi:protocatechuate 3,4-dioxygenase beta subunit [Herbihabitans rhizosphaerae]|uniref:Protocatechuate 3,4-dioxygenase beta subunit n=1 Tax=Herbihabitans rhizosphaerae TaxID=1872711 RepID=A0A4Q7KEJ1_9PSEU|nr:twin-arginine translocation pathway signal protein [Herbihabitans rhizosphaerae]RZS32501.1 protocatechuate 3,4-dioxygenase beta subunit [Herbihabitans rhizosphaerae]